MTSFAEVFADYADAETGAYTTEASSEWSQGRTLYGGLSAALCHAVAKGQADTDKPMKSALVCFVGPSGGKLVGESEVLRRGKSTVVCDATLRTEQGVGTRAVFVYGNDRESRLNHTDLQRPDVQGPDECKGFWGDKPRGGGPAFARKFDVHKAGGLMPLSGADRGELLVWCRHNTETGSDQEAALLALADVMPPASFTMFDTPAPLSTITWSLDLLQPDIEVGNNWFLFQSIAEHTAGGYSSQKMYLWDEAGRPVIAARQNVTVFL